jgi:hypothetical protein
MSALSILLVCVGSSWAQQAPDPERIDPHKDPTACGECHVSGPPDVGAAKHIVAACRACHPDGDMHPVEVDPGEQVIPPSFPTGPGGRMTCWTCHVDPMCPAGQKVPEPYLRDGPYEFVNQLCFSCHQRGEYERTNPHHPEIDRVEDTDSCTACHTARPEVGANPEQAKLRSVAGGVCMTCHDPFPHQGTTAHVGAELEPAVIAQLPPQIAVGEDRKVQCWSCHEVHDRPPQPEPRWLKDTRLSSAMTRLVLDHMAETEELVWLPPDDHGVQDHHPMLALPEEDGSLCRACHVPESHE